MTWSIRALYSRREKLAVLKASDLMRRVADPDEDPGQRQEPEDGPLPVFPVGPRTTLADARMIGEISGLTGLPVVRARRLQSWLDLASVPEGEQEQQVPVYSLAQPVPAIVDLDTWGLDVRRRLRRAPAVCVVSDSGILWGVVTKASFKLALDRELAAAEAQP